VWGTEVGEHRREDLIARCPTVDANYRCEPRRRVPCTATSVADTEPQRLGAGSAPGPEAPDLVSADGRRANSVGRFVLVAGVRGPLGGRLT